MLEDFVNGKRVAVIGGSESVIGTRFGKKIDSYDVVVRINCHWPCPLKLRPACDATEDIGKRTDIFFGSFGYLQMSRFKRMKVNMKLVVFNNFKNNHNSLEYYERKKQDWNDKQTEKFDELEKMLKRRNIEYYWYAERHEVPKTSFKATSGLLALLALLSKEPTEIFVTGFDFYTLGTPQMAWINHDPLRERNYFREHVASDKRVVLDDTAEKSLKSDLQGVMQISENNIKL